MLAQWIERPTSDRKVEGSSPSRPTNKFRHTGIGNRQQATGNRDQIIPVKTTLIHAKTLH
tara:strand:- start:1759 stop:1938 length:180 start_codon:yes stop_codon:yes gene_type:complete